LMPHGTTPCASRSSVSPSSGPIQKSKSDPVATRYEPRFTRPEAQRTLVSYSWRRTNPEAGEIISARNGCGVC
jgi:hypothetical protein